MGLSTASSVIVWSDRELLLLGRAVREDAADLTLYEWWRTEAGPELDDAFPPKDGEAELLAGLFEVTITEDEIGPVASGGLDRKWARRWTLDLSSSDGTFVGMPTYLHDGELLFGKPNLVIFHYESSFEGFGALCPGYQSVTWRERGRQVMFGDPVGHCRERNLDVVTFEPWTRIS